MDSPLSISSKLPKSGTSIFSVMSALANEQNALNLSQGFPSFDCNTHLKELVNKYIQDKKNQYAPMPGILALREAIAKKTEELYSTKYNPETEITVTAGATQAIYTAISALINEGDEVIVFEPAYDCYVPAIELNGGKAVYAQLKFPNYKVDWDEVKKLVKRQTKMIIINTPNNPTGSIFTAADMAKLEKIVKNTDIIILSDEVYEHIIFDKFEHQSVARYPKLAERSVIVSSFGKTFHTTGWKIGYVVAPEKLMIEFRKVHQFLVFSVNTPIQYAYADFLQLKEEYLGLGKFYQEKRDYFLQQIKGSRFEPLPCSGTYFQLLKYNKISEEKDTEIAKKFTIENKIASIPVSVFYHKPTDHNVLRFCFAKDKETLEKAGAILKKI
ncbi:MAG: methionine aminotransferase [Bacteroidota bacterium]|jgi:methionine aminotransferase